MVGRILRTRYQWRHSEPRDQWLSLKLHRQEEPLAWTKYIRTNERIALKQFIIEMSRWYGIKVSGLDCVEDRFISTRYCYRNTLDHLLEALEGVGATARLHHGVLHFCAPPTGPPLAGGQESSGDLVQLCCVVK